MKHWGGLRVEVRSWTTDHAPPCETIRRITWVSWLLEGFRMYQYIKLNNYNIKTRNILQGVNSVFYESCSFKLCFGDF